MRNTKPVRRRKKHDPNSFRLKSRTTPIVYEKSLACSQLAHHQFLEYLSRFDGAVTEYTQMQVADSIHIAAANEGGVAGLGMGAGLGFGMGGMMASQMAQAIMGQQQMPMGGAAAAPQAPAAPAKSLKEELTELKDLFDSQLLSQTEFDAQRANIMKKHGTG
ncbi:MAG: hypothetical protein IPQ13_07885 [Holophagaceae bacterium]|nr:hypothetical protein [Holophagaceae bacterium]